MDVRDSIGNVKRTPTHAVVTDARKTLGATAVLAAAPRSESAGCRSRVAYWTGLDADDCAAVADRQQGTCGDCRTGRGRLRKRKIKHVKPIADARY